MINDRIDLQDSIRNQFQDPIDVIAGRTTTLGTDSRPQRDVVPESGFEMAWALAH